jgi:murein DD-endopeptidase MepM/ murein hydrolase activator NlpD
VHPTKWIAWGLLVAAGAGVVAASYYKELQGEQLLADQILLAQKEARRIQSDVILFSERAIPSGVPFSAFLGELGVDPSTAARLVSAAQPVFDLRHLRAGNRLALGRSVLGELRVVRYRIDADHILWIAARDGEYRAEIRTIPSITETAGIAGEIHGSLFEDVARAGESPELAMRLAEIFAFDLDFYTDPRPGDTFRVVVEKKKLASGETVSYGHILAAEYNNDGRIYRAVLFHDLFGHEAYYTPEGKSLKRAFLHSPLKFAAPVTSHFSTHRLHPILKTYRAHLGTDYGAPIGTPVQTIGEGRVVFAGRKGGAGNLIQIQHSNGYQTYYMHLSRLLVHSGQRVEQGQRIGLVGMTGLATGPHLDFRIQHNGQFENFERLHLPSADPIARRDWSQFAAARDHSIGLLPDLHATLAKNSSPASVPVPDSTISR